MRFPRLKELVMLCRFFPHVTFHYDQWLQTMAGLTDLTYLDLENWQVSDDGLNALAGLTALTGSIGCSCSPWMSMA
jgi:hypothetical protein